jgi:hypothetical protein
MYERVHAVSVTLSPHGTRQERATVLSASHNAKTTWTHCHSAFFRSFIARVDCSVVDPSMRCSESQTACHSEPLPPGNTWTRGHVSPACVSCAERVGRCTASDSARSPVADPIQPKQREVCSVGARVATAPPPRNTLDASGTLVGGSRARRAPNGCSQVAGAPADPAGQRGSRGVRDCGAAVEQNERIALAVGRRMLAGGA